MRTLAFNFSQEIYDEIIELCVKVIEELEQDESENAPCLCNHCLANIVLQVFIQHVENIGNSFDLPTNDTDINLN